MIPLPNEEATPPVIKMYFVSIILQNLALLPAKLHQIGRQTQQNTTKRNYNFANRNTFYKMTAVYFQSEIRRRPFTFNITLAAYDIGLILSCMFLFQ